MVLNQDKDIISNGVNPVSFDAGRLNMGIGYVVLSRAMNRGDYIDNCYRNNVVTIKTDRGEIIKDCLVDKKIWDDIQFPLSYKDSGSLLIWTNIPFFSKCVIIAIINKKKDVVHNQKNSSFIGKIGERVSAFMELNGDDGAIRISSHSQTKGGGLFTRILNQDLYGICSTYVQGDFIVETENGVKLQALKNIEFYIGSDDEGLPLMKLLLNVVEGLKFQDSFGNNIEITDSGLNIIDANGNQIVSTSEGISILDTNNNKIVTSESGIVVNDGKEPAVLGNLFKQFMTDFITEVANSTVVTMIGIQPLLNASQIKFYQDQLDSFLSQQVFLNT